MSYKTSVINFRFESVMPKCQMIVLKDRITYFFMHFLRNVGLPLATAMLVFFVPGTTGMVKAGEIPPRLTATVANMPVKDALVLIEEKIGFKITLQHTGEEFNVSGQFVEADIDTVFGVLFHDYNIAVQHDEKKRAILVQLVNKKSKTSPIVARTLFNPEEQAQDTDNEQSLGEQLSGSATERGRDPFTGQSFEEIAALHAKQNEEIMKNASDPSFVDELTGMTNAEISELHKQNENDLRVKMQ